MEQSIKLPKEVTINGKVCKVPQSWKDITVGQYLRLIQYKTHDDIELMSIMLNISKEEIMDSEIEDLDLIIYGQLDWYVSEKEPLDSYLTKNFPKTVKIGDQEVEIPKDLKLKSFGQKISAEQTMASAEGKNPIIVLADVLAIYFYPEFTKEKFDYDKAIVFKDTHIMKMKITDGYPIGSFFLKRLRESLNKKVLIFLANMPKKKRQQILEPLKNSNNSEQ